jgi:hypothetical protein
MLRIASTISLTTRPLLALSVLVNLSYSPDDNSSDFPPLPQQAQPSGFAFSMGVRRSHISRTHAEDFLDTLKSLPIRLTDPLSYDDVFALADRHGLNVYDATYLDLAVREGLPLASLDGALIRAAGQSGVGIFQP